VGTNQFVQQVRIVLHRMSMHNYFCGRLCEEPLLAAFHQMTFPSLSPWLPNVKNLSKK